MCSKSSSVGNLLIFDEMPGRLRVTHYDVLYVCANIYIVQEEYKMTTGMGFCDLKKRFGIFRRVSFTSVFIQLTVTFVDTREANSRNSMLKLYYSVRNL